VTWCAAGSRRAARAVSRPDRRAAGSIIGAPSTEKRDEGKLRLEIRGELKSEPAPEWLCIATEIDIETGDCRVTETEGDPDE